MLLVALPAAAQAPTDQPAIATKPAPGDDSVVLSLLGDFQAATNQQLLALNEKLDRIEAKLDAVPPAGHNERPWWADVFFSLDTLKFLGGLVTALVPLLVAK